MSFEFETFANGRGILYTGDSRYVLQDLPDNSVDAIVTDPPYGLEFMLGSRKGAQKWDSFREGENQANWEGGGGFSKPGIGERETPWPSFSSTSAHGTTNPTCSQCGGRLRGKKRCTCTEPQWKPMGARRIERDADGEEEPGVTGYSAQMQNFQAWTTSWAKEALRVLKPGGHLLVFAGDRTYHRMACGVEDSGFEVRNMITWCNAAGFPKNLDVSRALDKLAGAEREVIGIKPGHEDFANRKTKGDTQFAEGMEGFDRPWMHDEEARARYHMATAPATELAKQFAGYGTALKPALEPILVARKPLMGTVARNVELWGTGSINVDGCRITVTDKDYAKNCPADRGCADTRERQMDFGMTPGSASDIGRWPSNFLLSHVPDMPCIACGTTGQLIVPTEDSNEEIFDCPYCKGEGIIAGCRRLGTELVKNASGSVTGKEPSAPTDNCYGEYKRVPYRAYGDENGCEAIEKWDCIEACPCRLLDEQRGITKSGASRFFKTFAPEAPFFFCSKASKKERNLGCEAFPEVISDNQALHRSRRMDEVKRIDGASPTMSRNNHPTVKPLRLIQYLVRLVTPPDGVVLDPFLGSGTTAVAAINEGFSFIGIERERDFVKIAAARIRHAVSETLLSIGPSPAAGQPSLRVAEPVGKTKLGQTILQYRLFDDDDALQGEAA